MIGYLEGKVAGRGQEACFIEVAGVGYRVFCSTSTLASLPAEGARCRVWVHTYVREDALALYGFATEAEQRIFEALLGVSGVGPRVALHVCSAFTPEQFRKTLATDDVDAITAVPGIGKKTAQRIVLDLKEKLALPDLGLVGSAPDTVARARSALENLGYSTGEVRAVLSEIAPSPDEHLEEVIRSALKVLAS
jgi:holliday junction DNA helicase RuvA